MLCKLQPIAQCEVASLLHCTAYDTVTGQLFCKHIIDGRQLGYTRDQFNFCICSMVTPCKVCRRWHVRTSLQEILLIKWHVVANTTALPAIPIESCLTVCEQIRNHSHRTHPACNTILYTISYNTTHNTSEWMDRWNHLWIFAHLLATKQIITAG